MFPAFLRALLLLATSCAFAQRPPASPPPPRGAILAQDPLAHPREVAAAEKAFARMAAERGAPVAFRECFTADGQVFSPGPRPVREVYNEPEGKPPGYRLEWTPEWVIASADGTLGFSTGPAELTILDEKGAPKGAARHHWFFSIWRADEPGRWRVALDMGVAVPPRGEALAHTECRMFAPTTPPASGDTGLAGAEEAFNQMARVSGLGSALAERLREDGENAGDHRTRWYREGAPPVDGRRGIVEAATREGGKPVFSTTAVVAAGSQDLGYSHGTFTAERDGRPVSGWFLRVWVREGQPARWRLAAQMTKTAPPKP